MNSMELRQQRAKCIEKARVILEQAEGEGRGLSGTEEREFDQLMARADVLTDMIAEAEGDQRERRRWQEARGAGLEAVEALLRERIAPVAAFGYQPGGGYLPADPADVRLLRPDQRMADVIHRDDDADNLSLGRLLRGVILGDWRGAQAERRALSVGTDSLGGFLVPEPLAARIIDLSRAQAVVMAAGALTVPMESSTLRLARVESDPTAYWRPENTAVTESDMSFGALNFSAKTLAAICRVSIELIEDAQNISGLVENAIAQALALELDRAALFGNGAAEPLGLLNWTGVQSISMGTNGAAITSYAPFSQAVQKVQEANGRPIALIWAPRTAGEVDRLTDSTGQPLQPPESFRSLRKLASSQVPVNMVQGTATNASVAIVGDFSQLLIGMRTQLVLEVSREASDAFGKLQALIRGYLRADVGVARPAHFCVIKGIIPPA